MIKYKTSNYGRERISAIDVERETDQSVWINGRRQAKASNYEAIYDSWTEARDALLHKAEHSLQSRQAQLQRAQDELEHIKGLKEKS